MIILGASVGFHLQNQNGSGFADSIFENGLKGPLYLLLLLLAFGAFVTLALFLLRQTVVQETLFNATTAQLKGRIEDSSIALSTSEERFQTLVQNLPGAVYRCAPDKDWTMDYLSEFTRELTGYSPSDFIGNRERTFASIIHPDDQKRVQEVVTEGSTSDGHFVLEYRIIRADGTVRWVNERGIVVQDANQRTSHLDGFILDVTDRREAERKARENTALLQTVIDHVPALIFMKDRLGRYMMVNRSWENATGVSRAEATLRTDEELARPDRHQTVAQDRMVFETGKALEAEATITYPDGTRHDHQVSRSPVFSEQGYIYALVGVRMDITSRKRAAVELAKARDAAEAANRAKSTFLANMSHEIRTPLNAVLGYSRLMQRDPSLSSDQLQRLATINRSGEHLLTLINTILEMSKIEAGHAVARYSTFSLRDILRDLESMFSLPAKERKLGLNFEIADELPAIVVSDEGKLRQILINLISNALKFTETGSVTIRTEVKSKYTDGNPPEVELQFEVVDTGIGLRKEDQEHIFEPFSQAPEGRDKSGGTGLGLSISREYAELLKGRLEVVSEFGRGSRFILSVRAEIRDPNQTMDRPEEHRVIGFAEGFNPLRVLVVADHLANREVLTLLLQEVGFDVVEATSVQEMIDEFLQFDPQLILIDIEIGKLDGVKRVRSLAEGTPPTIFSVSASPLSPDREQLMRIGIDEIIHKPFCEEDLFRAISDHTGVQFRRANAHPTASADSNHVSTMISAVGSLPAHLRSSLQVASHSGALSEIANLATEIRPLQPALADYLETLAKSFNLQGLHQIISKD